ncbi:hypothetical protein CCY99_07395 [Helicobacter sp. 16-1353]|uniref:DUF262 domain-containing protein n=1 Tax=Helicobacter sp. 16-1353 TaxID=2004996 RepID=UPI000DCB40E7|nr:DUF262 domain-containing protein [Helicobacter sp. 16-1353]RAX52463.1 hypothetical protein CCY99_07395 [Helicobacter sp. 16-1353]
MKQDYLKSLRELEGEKFYVRSYQRGYRWGDREVGDLLQDIWDFALYNQNSHKDSTKTSQDFYCLQPIVVNKKEQHYNVIDGQQRLTTIFLIIKFLKNNDFFEISYETRKDSDKNIY